MMKQTLIASAVACAFLAAAAPAMADDAPAAAAAPAADAAPPASPLTFNVGVVSDYLFRGISQTHGDPALQGGADYTFTNGFYVGTWLSTISWVKDYTGKGTTEWDLYGGYRGAFSNPDWTYDVGAIAYLYPGHGDAYGFGANPTTTEVRGQIGYKWLSAKYSYTTSSHFVGWYSTSGGKTDGSGYLEANAAYDLGNGWGVSGHTGHQTVKDNGAASYTDWNVGVTKDVGFGVFGLTYSDTNAQGDYNGGPPNAQAYSWPNGNFQAPGGSTTGYKNVSKGKALLTFLKTF